MRAHGSENLNSQFMELPIFNDNLRSSGSWSAALAQEQEAWKQARASLPAVETKLREHQVAQMLKKSGSQLAVTNLTEAATKVSAWASEPDAKLSPERLFDLYQTLTGAAADADVLRRTEAAPINAAHDPTPAILLPKMIDHAFDWFSTESFAELHPVEQATIAYMRLLDMYPFPAANEPAAMLSASFYTERAGLPPLILSADELTQARFAQTLEAAFRMLTQPLVEMFAEALRATIQMDQYRER
jgi:Fic family protein